MILQTSVVALIIMCLAAKGQAAAVKPFEASNPMMPAMKLAEKETSMVLKVSTSPLRGLYTIQSMGVMMPMPPSPDADVSMAMQAFNFRRMTIEYNPARLSKGEVETTGEVAVDFSDSNFTMILSASIAADGSCKLATEVAPIAMNMDISMSGMSLLDNAIAEAPAMLSSVKADALDFLTPSVLYAITDFINTVMASSAEGPTTICKSIIYGEPMSPIPTSS